MPEAPTPAFAADLKDRIRAIVGAAGIVEDADAINTAPVGASRPVYGCGGNRRAARKYGRSGRRCESLR